MKKITLLTLFLLSFCLMGCKKELTYSYLLQHPDVLKSELIRCQYDQGLPDCEKFLSTASVLMQTIKEQQDDPEIFGEKIMDVQSKYVTAKKNRSHAKKNLKELKDHHALPEDIQKAEVSLNDANNAYKEAYAELKLVLGVAALNSP